MRDTHSRPSRLLTCTRSVRRAGCASGMWGRNRAVEAYGDASCADTCGLWHGGDAGSCVGRGMWGRERAAAACVVPGVCVGCRDVVVQPRRMAMRRAPIRVACGTVVTGVAAWGAVWARDRDALAACGLPHLRRDRMHVSSTAPHGGDLAIHSGPCGHGLWLHQAPGRQVALRCGLPEQQAAVCACRCAAMHGGADRPVAAGGTALWPRSGDCTNGPAARVCGSAFCGGSAWPAGFAHAARGKSAEPPALHGLQLRGNCSP